MTSIRRILPEEFDKQGFPAFDIAVEYLRDESSWFAHCPQLPGYHGIARTHKEAIDRLAADFTKNPVCQVQRVKFDDVVSTKGLWTRLRDLGGSEAASEALKPNGNAVGFSQSDLFRARKQLRWVEERFQTKIALSDSLIGMIANFSAGMGGFGRGPFMRSLRARARIAKFLRSEGRAEVSDNADLM